MTKLVDRCDLCDKKHGADWLVIDERLNTRHHINPDTGEIRTWQIRDAYFVCDRCKADIERHDRKRPGMRVRIV